MRLCSVVFVCGCMAVSDYAVVCPCARVVVCLCKWYGCMVLGACVIVWCACVKV